MHGYDSQCYDLAEYFLRDVSGGDDLREQAKSELAQVIQDAIENWFAGAALASAEPQVEGRGKT